MQKLVQGVHRFERGISGPQRELFERLAEGQHPDALFITCSDSRISPNLITQTEPGELFIIRNAGNIVHPTGRPTAAKGQPSSSPWSAWASRTSSSADIPTAGQ